MYETNKRLIDQNRRKAGKIKVGKAGIDDAKQRARRRLLQEMENFTKEPPK